MSVVKWAVLSVETKVDLLVERLDDKKVGYLVDYLVALMAALLGYS